MNSEDIKKVLAQLHDALDSTVPTRHYDATWNALGECRDIIENLLSSLESHNHKRDQSIIKDSRIYLNILNGQMDEFDNYKFIYVKDHNPRDLLKHLEQQQTRRSRKKHHR